MNNVDLRTLMMQKSVRGWEVADALNIRDSNFSRLLRKELPEERKQEIRKIILSLAKERADNGGESGCGL